MVLTDRAKTVLKRFGRGIAAAGLTYAITKFPGLVGAFNVPGSEQALIIAAVIPVLTAADKWLRYGSDVGEGDSSNLSDN